MTELPKFLALVGLLFLAWAASGWLGGQLGALSARARARRIAEYAGASS